MNKFSLSSRISIIVTILSLLVLFSTLSTVYFFARKSLMLHAEHAAQYELDLMNHNLTKVRSSIEMSAALALPSIKRGMSDTTEVISILGDIVEKNPYISCAAVAYAPNRLPGITYNMPVAFNYGSVNHYFGEKEMDGDYRYDDWYKVPAEKGESYWTNPYTTILDFLVMGYAVPITSEEHGFEGVLTLSVELNHLNSLLAVQHEDSVESDHHHHNEHVLLDSRTMILSTPHPKHIMKESLFTLAEHEKDTMYSYIGHEIQAGRDGDVIMDVEGVKSVVTWRVSPTLNWASMIISPYSEVYATLNHLFSVFITVALVAFIIAIIIFFISVRRLLSPMKQLQKATRLLGEGKFDTKLSDDLTGRPDEIGDLGREFMRMESRIKISVNQLECERQNVQESNDMLTTLVHNVVKHLQVPINNMINFTEGLSTLVEDTEETVIIKNEAQEAGKTILKQFNQLNEMVTLVASNEEDADAMVVIPSNEFVDDALKGSHQLEENFFLTLNEEYKDKRKINIRTNTLTLESLLYQLIVEAAAVSKTNEIGLYSVISQDLSSLRLMIEAKTDSPIPSDEKANFFKRFAKQKIEAYASSDYLQLYLCYRTAKRLGARIYVDPEFKDGNLFVLELKKA